jgi:Holliday junction resolvase
MRTLEGKKFHQELMRLAGIYLKNQGYVVVFSARIDSGVVDVVGIKDKEKVGIECQLVPSPTIIKDKMRKYSPFLTKLVLAVSKNTKVNNVPKEIEVIRLDVEIPEKVTIRINRGTLKRIGECGSYGETLDDIINKVMNRVEKKEKI